MEQIDTGRNIGRDPQKILAMFEVGGFLLKKWGEKVGVDADGEVRADHRSVLDDDEDRSIIYSILANMERWRSVLKEVRLRGCHVGKHYHDTVR